MGANIKSNSLETKFGKEYLPITFRYKLVQPTPYPKGRRTTLKSPQERVHMTRFIIFYNIEALLRDFQ